MSFVSSSPSLEQVVSALSWLGEKGTVDLSATSFASWGWLLPVKSFIEFVAMAGTPVVELQL